MFGQRSAAVFAVQLSAMSWIAESGRYSAQEVLTGLQVDKDSDEKGFDELKHL